MEHQKPSASLLHTVYKSQCNDDALLHLKCCSKVQRIVSDMGCHTSFNNSVVVGICVAMEMMVSQVTVQIDAIHSVEVACGELRCLP